MARHAVGIRVVATCARVTLLAAERLLAGAFAVGLVAYLFFCTVWVTRTHWN